MVWDVKNLPELVEFSAEERKKIERSSAFLVVWDWRTLIFIPLGAACFRLPIYAGAPKDSREEAFLLLGSVFLAIFVWFAAIYLRTFPHARYIADRWQNRTPISPDALPGTGVSVPWWRRLTLHVGLCAGMVLVFSGFFFRFWELALLGAEIMIVGVGLGTSYTVCGKCHHLQVQIGVRLKHCPKCGVPDQTSA